MGWGWKAFGAVIGAVLGGPIGAGLGALIGHGLDSANEMQPASNQGIISNLKQRQVVYSVASFLTHVARADGNFDAKERALIADICCEIAPDLRLDLGQSNQIITSVEGNQQLLAAVLNIGRQSPDFRRALLVFAWRVASRDMQVTDDEIAWIESVAQQMGAPKNEIYSSMLPFHRMSELKREREWAAKILGVPVNADSKELKARYRHLSQIYHPDRNMNKTKEMQDQAAAKFAEIATAYQTLSDGKTKPLFGLAAQGAGLVEPAEALIVACFMCGQKCRLPENDKQDSARCPKCQALLLQPSDVAKMFTARASGPFQ